MKATVVFSMALGGALLGMVGCASAPAQPMARGANAHVRFVAEGLSLTPLRVEDCSLRGVPGNVRLYLGAMFTAPEDGDSSYGRVSLVIRAARDFMEPMLARNRRILLDVDGEILVIGQHPDPALYSYRLMGGGYLETVIVPVNLEVLERLSRAEHVTGRLGPWINFGLSEDFADGFAAFLNAVRQEMSAEQRSRRVRRVRPRTDRSSRLGSGWRWRCASSPARRADWPLRRAAPEERVTDRPSIVGLLAVRGRRGARRRPPRARWWRNWPETSPRALSDLRRFLFSWLQSTPRNGFLGRIRNP